MPRNGSGAFSRVYSWVADAAAALKISSSRMDADTDDIAAALTASIAKDGQTTPTASLPMGGFKHTNVAAGSSRTHYVQIGQHQDGGTLYGGTAGGTANALTATLAPAITAYATGQIFSVKAASDNTGAATINFNSVAAKAIKRPDGSALQAGDIKSGQTALLEYDGTNMQLLNKSFNGALLGIQYLTATGTYTPTAGTALAIAHLQGAGGGSPGKSASGAYCGGGGGAGAYAVVHLASPAAQSVTVGAGGTAGNGATAGTGGSTVMASVTCSGGVGGAYLGAGSGNTLSVAGGAGGTVSGGSPSLSIAGANGGDGWCTHNDGGTTIILYNGGAGADSPFGRGPHPVVIAAAVTATAGVAGVGYGAGASASVSSNAGSQAAGAAGAAGIIIVYEYA